MLSYLQKKKKKKIMDGRTDTIEGRELRLQHKRQQERQHRADE